MYSYDKNGKRIEHSQNKQGRENYTEMTFKSSSGSSSGGKHHWIFIVLGIIAAVILLGVIYYVYFRTKSKEGFSLRNSPAIGNSQPMSFNKRMGGRKSSGFQWFNYPKKR